MLCSLWCYFCWAHVGSVGLLEVVSKSTFSCSRYLIQKKYKKVDQIEWV